MKFILSVIFIISCPFIFAQNKNYVLLSSSNTETEIIRKAANVVPSARQLRWQKLELTAFFHFGINSFTNSEWGTGKEDPQLFNPTAFDAMQWVRVAKDAGFKLVMITAKHHDGFCLWPTATTNHSVAKSPWKNGQGDVVKEVAEACKKYGLELGIYLSPWDRNAAVYGTDAYNDFFVKQLTELLTNYGPIGEVWFDGANGEGPNGKKQVYDFDGWYSVIRKLQPHAVIAIMGPDVRWVGTETGYGRSTEWSVVPANNLNPENISAASQQFVAFKPQGDMRGDDLGSRKKIMQAKGLVWYPAETDVSIRPGWFFHPQENEQVKTPQKLLDIYFNSVGRNGVLLLNLPPDTRGLIHEADVKSLQVWKKLRDRIFKHNLAKKAKIISPNGLNKNKLIDGKYATFWTTKGNDSTATLNFIFKKPQTFNVLLLQENIAIGQRIEKFIVQYHDGQGWQNAVEGTTVGYKRLLKFKNVRAKKIRIQILSSRLNPTLSEIGLFFYEP